ncbi:MAG TPA: hypothetical protein VNX27_04160 [Chthoniobacterales bacterium]|jgi:hypothetical protein|nr:hypothetical protein [Chthoniobacterales bacterium]
MPNVIQLQANLPWLYTVDLGSNRWVAVCPPLKLTIEAEDPQDFLETIKEAIDGFFKELLSTGDLDRFLDEHGWQRLTPIPDRRRGLHFDVPLSTQRVQERDLQQAVY